MRWNGLFADLEAQMGRELEVEEGGVAADELRLERGRRHLPSRIADLGRSGPLVIRFSDGSTRRVRVEAVGIDWIAGLDADARRSLIIPLSAVVTAARVGESESASASASADQDSDPDRTELSVRVVLRDLARRRRAVTVSTTAGTRHGTIDAVGSDHIELAVHADDVARRRREVTSVELVAVAAVLFVAY